MFRFELNNLDVFRLARDVVVFREACKNVFFEVCVRYSTFSAYVTSERCVPRRDYYMQNSYLTLVLGFIYTLFIAITSEIY